MIISQAECAEKMQAPTQVTVIRRAEFSASHFFWVPEWTDAENFAAFGPVANRFSHGHNYELIAAIRGTLSPVTGMVVNLKTVKAHLNAAVIAPLNFKCLNYQVPFFTENQPSLEALSVYVFHRLAHSLAEDGLSLDWIELRESRELAIFYGGEPVEGVHMGRLHEPSLEDAPELSPHFAPLQGLKASPLSVEATARP